MPTIKNRRATKSQWSLIDPVLAAGEIGLEIGTNKLKIGNGLSVWSKLSYVVDETKWASLVAAAIANNETVIEAAANAVGDQVTSRKLVGGATSTTTTGIPEIDDLGGGFIGENGRTTDLVFDHEGKVPDDVIAEWSDRILSGAGLDTLAGGASSEAAGGFVGENGRETDLIVLPNGEVPQSTILRWAPRLSPYLTPPPVDEPDPIETYSPAARRFYVRDRNGTVRPFSSSPDKFAAWGDSLTDGWTKPPFAVDQSDAWPGVLATLLGKPVYNGGKSGQSADEIALRQSGLVIIAAPVGGSIPASGAVEVTGGSSIAWRVDRGWTCVGTLAGVPGTLSRASGSTTLTFTRTTSGTAVATTGSTFVSDVGVSHLDSTNILMMGRNDIGYTSPAGDIVKRIVAANIACVEALTPAHPRFLILGTLNSTGEYTNSSGWTQVTESNRILSELYPDNYFDIRNYIVHQSIYDQALTPTADDLVKMSNDAPPPSIMLDGIHYNVATAATIANKIKAILTEKAWLS